jgi:hypothetical protein
MSSVMPVLRVPDDSLIVDLMFGSDANRVRRVVGLGFIDAALEFCKRRRRQRKKPSIGRMIAAAERGGKKVTSVTTPEGVTLRFGESEPVESSNNPWLADLKVTKQ